MDGDLRRYLGRCATVGELIAELEQFDEDAPVLFERCSGDYWRSRVCEGVSSRGEGAPRIAKVGWTDYHQLPQPLGPDDDGSEEAADREPPPEGSEAMAVVFRLD